MRLQRTTFTALSQGHKGITTMRHRVLLLAILIVLVLVDASYAGAGFRPKKKRDIQMARNIKQPSQHDKDVIRFRVMKVVSEEMPDANEEEMLRRVNELTEARLKEAFPEFYAPKPEPKKYFESENIWENGTVVRYMARVLALVLGITGLIAFKEQLLGRETFDGKKIQPVKEKKNK